ncbi:PAS domain-containing protein [Alloacidobacterium dinghuense]|uniref:PAS domain-containing protein n=1 Tax=Alloacidobacterium dinghuense TaxID=2763107 RepID=A0A7G8BEB3_9BACT|nr:chemotaxis protein CheB [Alloacidobacterium dinghuense]QNI30883.1 PAS domain-containing protein [Alloacidobacterium dinghuense]
MTPSKRNNTASKRGAPLRPKRAREAEAPEEPYRKSTFPIVGIGASAGGLEAFTSLLKALSPDLGMAFIFVPHLDPSRESAFTQILARATSMPVLTASDGLAVEANHIYVIPPNRDLRISDATLHVDSRGEPRSFNTTIDIFFRSLAADQGSNAIGVILSGTASDGTLGLTAIKGEGGITFAQDAGTAKYDGMPASAIAAECVDFVLPPEGIAMELARIRQHPYVAGAHMEHVDAGDKGLDTYLSQVFRLLRRATKVDFSEYKPPTIGRRIQRRMALHKIEKISEYLTLLHRDRIELTALYQDLLINVTSFFRNPEAFDILKQVVYPAVLQARNSTPAPIRIWVPGCSTGEETYSHAMSLVEFLGEERTEVPIQIFGTDLSESAIQRARAGVYKESIEADVNPMRLRRFFHKSDGGYQISKTIRDLCIFSTQNVFSDPPFSRMDLVSCRNVMIYLSQTLQKRVIPIFHYALNPTGFLMIGSTEGLLGAGSELFEMADKKQKIYRKKMVSTPVTFGFSIGQSESKIGGAENQPPPAKVPDTSKAPIELQREADRLLLARYTPPAVVINDQLEILQSRGRTGSFLELPTGKASLNLLKMARPGLLFELQNAVEEARKSGVEAKRQNVTTESNGSAKQITVRVIPFKAPIQDRQSFLVVFEHASPETQQLTATETRTLTETEQSERDKQTAQLKQELAATKEYLQSIIETQEATNEELQSANEEVQSGNEELQSTNEELQTSKEELESANEELHTVNEEMQHRNELLAQLNNDLTNLLNSVNLPMVMVGADLSVRRFTPQATATLGLMTSDVGRPIPRLKLKIDVANLEQMMLDVIQEVQPRQYEVQDQEGRWCSLRITPYRTLDNRVDGVVLSVVDKTAFNDLPHADPSKTVRQSPTNKTSRVRKPKKST